MTISSALPDVKATPCRPRFALLTVLNVMHSTQLSWTDIGFPVYRLLVHRLAYSGDVAAGQLAVFQGASEAPIPPHFCLLLVWPFRSRRKMERDGSSEQRGKTANWPRPGGLRLKWAGGRVARRLRIDLDMRPLMPVRLGPPCRRPILNATTSSLYARRCTRADGYSSGPIHQI